MRNSSHIGIGEYFSILVSVLSCACLFLLAVLIHGADELLNDPRRHFWACTIAVVFFLSLLSISWLLYRGKVRESRRIVARKAMSGSELANAVRTYAFTSTEGDDSEPGRERFKNLIRASQLISSNGIQDIWHSDSH